MDLSQRREWNDNHKVLTEIITKSEEHLRVPQLFVSLHALLHSSEIGDTVTNNIQDEVLNNISEVVFRKYPVANPDTRNSIAWHIWHITRIEDMTMNILVADDPQVFYVGNWNEQMNVEFSHSGNDMNEDEIAAVSSKICFDSLLAYRRDVCKRTRSIVSELQPGQFRSKVDPNRIKRLFDENAVTDRSKWLADYWSKKTIAGLILMPATRHSFLHLNKCVRIKDKLQKQMKNVSDDPRPLSSS